jgi:hypothetical protein
MMTLTANEVLGAFQLGLISANEAREALGFTAIVAETIVEGDSE